jgi:hypothetical protein
MERREAKRSAKMGLPADETHPMKISEPGILPLGEMPMPTQPVVLARTANVITAFDVSTDHHSFNRSSSSCAANGNRFSSSTHDSPPVVSTDTPGMVPVATAGGGREVTLQAGAEST